MNRLATLALATLSLAAADAPFRDVTIQDRPMRCADVRRPPLLLTGLPFRDSPDAPLHRLPAHLTKADVNEGALGLSSNPSGAAVLLRTDSPVIGLISSPCTGAAMQHMPATGVSGYDVYERITDRPEPAERFIANVRTVPGGAIAHTGAQPGKPIDLIIYLPLYSRVDTLEIAVTPDARVEPPTPQRLRRPIVFYGSSITQGGCCSRPGNNYTTMICRALDAPQVNLGFSGSAKGEPAIAKAIATLDAELLVLDYDHNAPSPEHLRNTHEPFFRIIRQAHPSLPIVILSRPDTRNGGERRDIIRQTYENAVAAGDRHVYFISGDTLFSPAGTDFCTVDGCHPNDLGFYMMYTHVLPVVRQALGLK